MPAAATAIQPDRRSALRHKSFFRAQIVDGSKISTIDCLMRDVSETGARLCVPGFPALPSTFELKVYGRSSSQAWLVWNGNEVSGVTFVDPASPRTVTPALLRALEDENKQLAAIVEDLTARLESLTH